MKISQIMTSPAIHIHPAEQAVVAARMMTHYNIGALPVCTADGCVCGMVTDRDLVTRCMASGNPGGLLVRDVMTTGITAVTPDTQVHAAAELMGRRQIRRLPVVNRGVYVVSSPLRIWPEWPIAAPMRPRHWSRSAAV